MYSKILVPATYQVPGVPGVLAAYLMLVLLSLLYIS